LVLKGRKGRAEVSVTKGPSLESGGWVGGCENHGGTRQGKQPQRRRGEKRELEIKKVESMKTKCGERSLEWKKGERGRGGGRRLSPRKMCKTRQQVGGKVKGGNNLGRGGGLRGMEMRLSCEKNGLTTKGSNKGEYFKL